VSSKGGRRRRGIPPALLSDLQDVADGKALMITPPLPGDQFGNYQYAQALKALAPAFQEPAPERPVTPSWTDHETTTTDEESMSQPNPTSAAIQSLTAAVDALSTRLNEHLSHHQAEPKVVYVERDPLLDEVLEIYRKISPMKLSHTDAADELDRDAETVLRACVRLNKEGKLDVHEKRNEGSSKTFRKWSYVS
jgi:hypothetical protein